jgi:hypothetical protein
MTILRPVEGEKKDIEAAAVEKKRLELRLGNHGRRRTINTRPMIADPPSSLDSVHKKQESLPDFTFGDAIEAFKRIAWVSTETRPVGTQAQSTILSAADAQLLQDMIFSWAPNRPPVLNMDTRTEAEAILSRIKVIYSTFFFLSS